MGVEVGEYEGEEVGGGGMKVWIVEAGKWWGEGGDRELGGSIVKRINRGKDKK